MVSDDTNGAEDTFLRDRARDVINEHVILESLTYTFQSQRNGKECGEDFVGRFLFSGLLVNQSNDALSNLQVPVKTLTRGNRLLTDMGLIGPNGEFPVPERDEYADGILGPGESVTIPFEVCLKERKSFQLYVDVAEDQEADN